VFSVPHLNSLITTNMSESMCEKVSGVVQRSHVRGTSPSPPLSLLFFSPLLFLPLFFFFLPFLSFLSLPFALLLVFVAKRYLVNFRLKISPLVATIFRSFKVMHRVIRLRRFCKLLTTVAILSEEGGGTCLECLNGTTTPLVTRFNAAPNV